MNQFSLQLSRSYGQWFRCFYHLVHTNIKERTWIFCQCKSWAPCWLLVVLACQVGNGSRESDSSMHSFTINNRVRSTQSQYKISFKGLWKYRFRYKVLSVDVQGLWKYQFRYKVLSVDVLLSRLFLLQMLDDEIQVSLSISKQKTKK